jgi:hypothetical protein
MDPVAGELGYVFNPVFPNAPLCTPGQSNNGLSEWQGVKLPRLHSYWSHNPPTASIKVSGQTDEQRKFHLEAYSLEFGNLCRNTWASVGWQVQNVGTANIQIQQYDGPVRVVLQALAAGTADRVIGTQWSKSDTVMVSATN